MYVLAIETAGYRQLRKLQAGLLDGLERDCRAIVESNGGELLTRSSGVSIYRFRFAGSHDLSRIVSAAWSVERRYHTAERDLFGYTICLEQIVANDEVAMVEAIDLLLKRVPQENGLWIGRNAVTTITPFLQMERRLDLWKATAPVEDAAVLPAVADYIDGTKALTSVLDELEPLINTEGSSGVVLLYGAEGSGAGLLARRAAAAITGAQSVPALTPVPGSAEPLSIGGSLAAHEHCARVEEYLSEAERDLWRRVSYALHGAWFGRPGEHQPDHQLEELMPAVQLFMSSYVRRMRDSSNIAVLIIDRIDSLDDRVARMVVDACSEDIHSGALVLIATSGRPFLPAPFRTIAYRKHAVHTMTTESISSLLGDLPPGLHVDGTARVRSLTRGRLLHLYHYLWLVERRGDTVPVSDDEDGVDRLVKMLVDSMNSVELEALWLASFCAGCFTQQTLTEMLVAAGHPADSASEVWAALKASGFVYEEGPLIPIYESIVPTLSDRLARRAHTLGMIARDGLYRWFRCGELELSPDRYRMLAEHRDTLVALEAFSHFSNSTLLRGDGELLQALLDGALGANRAADDPPGRHEIEVLSYALRLAQASRGGEYDSAASVYSSWQNRVSDKTGKESVARLTLERTRYQYTIGNFAEADQLARHTVLLYQELGSSEGGAEAHIEFGRIKLAEGHAADAREYLALGRAERDSGLPAIHYARSEVLEGVTSYLYGNYSRALELCEQSAAMSREAFARDWELFAGFVVARVAIELGRYEEAEERLFALCTQARRIGHEKAHTVLEAWHGRALSLGGSIRRACELLRKQERRPEAAYFLAEALDQNGDTAGAIEVLERRQPARNPRLRPTLTARWCNGFDGIEASVGSEGPESIAERLCAAFHGYLLGKSGHTDEAVDRLRQCSREVGGSGLDPNLSLLLFWYSSVLPETGDELYDDPATELGRSVKLAQERVSRIDSPQDKNDYRFRNSWNRSLFELARRHNLA